MIVYRDTLISSLSTSIPEFDIDPDWIEGPLGYPLINDLARFALKQIATGNTNAIERIGAFLEGALQSEDGYLEDLVLEFLDNLRTCDKAVAVIAPHFGQQTRSLWEAR